jgi:alpha-1,6-mannosyltransferase
MPAKKLHLRNSELSRPGNGGVTALLPRAGTILCVIAGAATRVEHRAPPVVCDVAMFYAEQGGGIRTYLDEKARFADRSGAFEHHLIFPGRRHSHRGGRRHEVPSLMVEAANGYRVPLGAGALKDTLRRLSPDFVILHDPFWRPVEVTRTAHRLGAKVIAVHHASPALQAAGIPGPDAVYLQFLKRVYRNAYDEVDAVMSAVDSRRDCGRSAALPLRFGLDPAFRPGPARRGRHLLYVGRLSLEKRVRDLLAAAAVAPWRPPVWLVGDGPARASLEQLAQRLGLSGRVRFMPFVSDRRRLARLYREAACVVAPGPHETFGLAVLEAAASGARVVACSCTPAAAVAGSLVERFEPKDPRDLLRAVEVSLASRADAAAAAALAERYTWARVFEAELERLRSLFR